MLQAFKDRLIMQLKIMLNFIPCSWNRKGCMECKMCFLLKITPNLHWQKLEVSGKCHFYTLNCLSRHCSRRRRLSFPLFKSGHFCMSIHHFGHAFQLCSTFFHVGIWPQAGTRKREFFCAYCGKWFGLRFFSDYVFFTEMPFSFLLNFSCSYHSSHQWIQLFTI